MWDIKQFNKPTKMSRLSAVRSVRQPAKPNGPSSLNRSTLRAEDSIASRTSSIL